MGFLPILWWYECHFPSLSHPSVQAAAPWNPSADWSSAQSQARSLLQCLNLKNSSISLGGKYGKMKDFELQNHHHFSLDPVHRSQCESSAHAALATWFFRHFLQWKKGQWESGKKLINKTYHFSILFFSFELLLQLLLAVMPHILNNKTKQGNHTEVDSQAPHTMTMKTYEGSDSPHSISSLRLGLPASCVIQPWRQILAEWRWCEQAHHGWAIWAAISIHDFASWLPYWIWICKILAASKLMTHQERRWVLVAMELQYGYSSLQQQIVGNPHESNPTIPRIPSHVSRLSVRLSANSVHFLDGEQLLLILALSILH